MLYFLIIGFLITSSVFVLPKSIFTSNNIDPKKVLYVGLWSFGIAGLFFIFHNFWVITLAIIAIFLYDRIFNQ